VGLAVGRLDGNKEGEEVVGGGVAIGDIVGAHETLRHVATHKVR